jgi:hypothetical protein
LVLSNTDSIFSRSPCGVNGILNVNNRIGLSTERGAPASAAGELSDDDATVHFDKQVNLAWQPCGPKQVLMKSKLEGRNILAIE